MSNLSEKTSLSISLPMLIQADVGIGALVAMWTSTQADLSALQKDVGQLQDRVNNLINMQDNEIPADIKQNSHIYHLEKEMDRLRDIVDKK